jgi:D-alanyl-D-alanine carboxypeptidase
MTSGPSRSGPDWIQWLLVGLIVIVVAASAAGRGDVSAASSPSTAAPTLDAPRTDQPPTLGAPEGALSREHRGALGAADGVLPDGTTAFDDDLPGVAKLEPGLLAALRRAATDAANDGVAVFVESGWRSPNYQEALLRQAVSTYGSEAAAARWVATPITSPHVSGDAVDIRNVEATTWLSAHGARYGLCQIYRNEPWHYELRPGAVDDGCPQMYADPTRDPRMRQ